MSVHNHFVFKDRSGRLWEFHLSEEQNLMYSAESADSKDKVGGRIAADVSGFAADIDKNGTPCFVYVKKEQLKYFKLDNDNLPATTIHSFKGSNFLIRELRLCLIGKNASIFFLFQKDPEKNVGSIYHCLWDGKKPSTNIIGEINLLPGGQTNYQAEVLGNGEILLLFTSNDGREVLFKSCMYKNKTFSNVGLLYALKGNSVDFHMVRHHRGFHILNLSRYNQRNVLEVIYIVPPGVVKSVEKIYECGSRISHPLLMVEGNNLWAFWKSGDQVLYASLANGWSKIMELEIGVGKEVRSYLYIDRAKKGGYKVKRILGTAPPGIKLIFPNKLQGENESELLGDVKASRVWEQLPGKQEQKTIGFSGPTPTPRALPQHISHDSGWSGEMYQNCATLARQKIELEGRCNKLTQDNITLQVEVGKLKELLLGEKQQVTQLETKIRNLEIENITLKGNLEVKKSKGFFDMVFKRW